MLQEETAELFSDFISKRSIVFNAGEEDFMENYKKIYNLINTEEEVVQ